jgi:hypothetical protein
MLARVKSAMAKRKNNNDTFRIMNNYSWDYVLVFKVYLDSDKLTAYQRKHSLKDVLAALAAGGLETRLFYSAQVHLCLPDYIFLYDHFLCCILG